MNTYHNLGLISLLAYDLIELAQPMLQRLQNMRLKLRKAVLHLNKILPVVVLLNDLLVHPVSDTALQDVWIIGRRDLAAGGIEGCGLLSQALNVPLGGLAGLIHRFAALASALGELLGLGLDFGVETLEDGEDGAFEDLGGLVVRVGDALVKN
jgi:hypothetical protein